MNYYLYKCIGLDGEFARKCHEEKIDKFSIRDTIEKAYKEAIKECNINLWDDALKIELKKVNKSIIEKSYQILRDDKKRKKYENQDNLFSKIDQNILKNINEEIDEAIEKDYYVYEKVKKFYGLNINSLIFNYVEEYYAKYSSDSIEKYVLEYIDEIAETLKTNNDLKRMKIEKKLLSLILFLIIIFIIAMCFDSISTKVYNFLGIYHQGKITYIGFIIWLIFYVSLIIVTALIATRRWYLGILNYPDYPKKYDKIGQIVDKYIQIIKLVTEISIFVFTYFATPFDNLESLVSGIKDASAETSEIVELFKLYKGFYMIVPTIVVMVFSFPQTILKDKIENKIKKIKEVEEKKMVLDFFTSESKKSNNNCVR